MKVCKSLHLFLSLTLLLTIQCRSLGTRSAKAPNHSHKGIQPDLNPSVASEYEVLADTPEAATTQKDLPKEDRAPKKVKEASPKVAQKRNETNTSHSCPKSLSPNQLNCGVFPEGCVYVPATVTQRPLIYFRGLIQDKPSKAPASTEHLFSPHGSYHLDEAATANGQMILATHSHTTRISERTLHCLKEVNHYESVDVASHSAGYQGLNSSAATLAGSVGHLYLLDNFYNTDSVLSSVSTIRPQTCSGFYTNHKNRNGQSIASNAKNVEAKTSCDLRQLVGHVSNVAPVLKEQGNGKRVVDSKSASDADHAGAI